MKNAVTIAVTGGAGFIGSNLVRGLNRDGYQRILVVDDLSDGGKFRNLAGLDIHDYMDRAEFMARVSDAGSRNSLARELKVVFHQGACADTMELNGAYMLRNNFSYSRDLLDFCAANSIPFIYASSASVYGSGDRFSEERSCECPINVYGYSKMLFDHHVRNRLGTVPSQVAGLRYFNVYGPNEEHKGAMASVAFQLNRQLKNSGVVRLFRGSGGYGDGEQRRDFVFVDDVVKVNLWMMHHPGASGVFNVGTGASRTFNELARQIIKWHGRGSIEYIDMPEGLADRYQNFTQADLGSLRGAGYGDAFTPIEEGVTRYLDRLNNASGA